jgi:aminoglycoside phosphotransferase (APT) family kinase protein
MQHRSTDAIAAALRAALPEGDTITGVTQLSGGHSNETYVVEGLNQILRMPPAGAKLLESAFDVVGQHAILTELRQTALASKIPEISWFDPEGRVLGAPAFLMKRLPGKPWTDWAAPDWVYGQPEAFLSRISEQLVDALVTLHAMPPLVAYGPVRSNASEVERWRDSIIGIARPAEMDEAIDLLIRNAPDVQQASPVHGDPKLPNMLWDDGVLTGMLDWEIGFNGDARWDISYLAMPFESDDHPAYPGHELPGLWQADRLFAEWSARSGRSTDRMAWFEAANFICIASIHAYGYNLFHKGLTDDVRFKAFIDHVPRGANSALTLARRDAAAL